MKKSIILAGIAAASMFFSCTKAEIELPQNEIISFQVANNMSQTKALTGTTFPTDENFGTYAWTNSANSGDQHQVLMTEQTVGCINNVWQPVSISGETKSAETFYWPKNGNVDFISYYPAGDCWFDIDDDADKLTATGKTISGSDNDTDYMYADKAIGCTYENSGNGVNTLFHHALAQVSVKFAAAKDSDGNGVSFGINVTSAKFTNINKTGDLVLNCKADGTWTAPEVWSATDSGSDFEMLVGGITTTATTVVDHASVLPQTIGSDNKLEIAYTVTTTYPSGASVSENLVADPVLTGLNVNSWNINKHITYTITIDPSGLNPITFLPSISDWSDESKNNDISIN